MRIESIAWAAIAATIVTSLVSFSPLVIAAVFFTAASVAVRIDSLLSTVEAETARADAAEASMKHWRERLATLVQSKTAAAAASVRDVVAPTVD